VTPGNMVVSFYSTEAKEREEKAYHTRADLLIAER